MEYKALPTFTKAVSGRVVSGLFAVHGNVDSTNDRLQPGSFQKTIVERVAAQKVKFLWSHAVGDYWMGVVPEPPIAVVKEVRELTRDELQTEYPKVLMQAPEATGGVEVVREYLDTTRGNEVLKGLQAGAITEMSWGFDAVKYDFEEVNDTRIRNLREVRLWEVSDVLWGANEATVAAKWLPSTDTFLKALQRFTEQLKSGARHSASDTELLNQIHAACVDLGATTCKGIVSADDADAEEEEDAGKSRAAAEVEEKSALAALTSLKSELEILELSLSF